MWVRRLTWAPQTREPQQHLDASRRVWRERGGAFTRHEQRQQRVCPLDAVSESVCLWWSRTGFSWSAFALSCWKNSKKSDWEKKKKKSDYFFLSVLSRRRERRKTPLRSLWTWWESQEVPLLERPVEYDLNQGERTALLLANRWVYHPEMFLPVSRLCLYFFGLELYYLCVTKAQRSRRYSSSPLLSPSPSSSGYHSPFWNVFSGS